MFSLRPMMVSDLFSFNNINLDKWTEMYTTQFYVSYLSKWPDLCVVCEAGDGSAAGYIIAKVEGQGSDWHSHITALSVAPEYRMAGVAARLLDYFEKVSAEIYDCFYADLYVRVSNDLAIKLYRSRGYVVYRTVLSYYGGEENAEDMRKPLRRDKTMTCIKGAGHSVEAREVS